MWLQRSSVWIQGSSLCGVSFVRALHAVDDGSADAPDGASRPTARQATTSHGRASREVKRWGMWTSHSSDATDPAAHIESSRRAAPDGRPMQDAPLYAQRA